MTGTLNGDRPRAHTVGTDAMKLIPPAERTRRHNSMAAFLDSGKADGMTINEVAEAVGISRAAVYSEFVKRRVPMTAGRAATYGLPPSLKGKPGRRSSPRADAAPPGKAEGQIKSYLETGGQGSNAAEIARATGLPRTTVRDSLARMGLLAPGGARGQAPPAQEDVLAEVASITDESGPASGSRPEGQIRYLHQISDGRHAAIDLLTGRLWEMEVVRPL